MGERRELRTGFTIGSWAAAAAKASAAMLIRMGTARGRQERWNINTTIT